MREIATIMTEAEFEKELDSLRIHTEEMQREKAGRPAITRFILGYITSQRGNEHERTFTESQIAQAYALAED